MKRLLTSIALCLSTVAAVTCSAPHESPAVTPAPIPQVATTPATAITTNASTNSDQDAVSTVAVPSEAPPLAAVEPATVDAATIPVVFNSPACATCSPAYRPQPAIQPRQYQPQTRRGILGGRFRR